MLAPTLQFRAPQPSTETLAALWYRLDHIVNIISSYLMDASSRGTVVSFDNAYLTLQVQWTLIHSPPPTQYHQPHQYVDHLGFVDNRSDVLMSSPPNDNLETWRGRCRSIDIVNYYHYCIIIIWLLPYINYVKIFCMDHVIQLLFIVV